MDSPIGVLKFASAGDRLVGDPGGNFHISCVLWDGSGKLPGSDRRFAGGLYALV